MKIEWLFKLTRMIIKSASGQRVMLMPVYKADCAWSHIRLSSILHRLKVLFFRLEYLHKFTNSIITRFINLKALDQPDFHCSLLTDQIPFAVSANILRYPPTHEFEADVLCFYPDRGFGRLPPFTSARRGTKNILILLLPNISARLSAH